MASSPPSSYDKVPYESLPFPQSHPDRLGVLARLFGVAAPAPEGARVLELGCAAGGNLIPLALSLPDAEFVGVDLSDVQTAEGRRDVSALGLRNIRLETASIMDVDDRWGQFDYIISHGVYSWVPTEVQDRILRIVGTQLTDNGVGYISYNTLPGWRMRGMVRDLMRYHATQFEEAHDRVGQARAILEFLTRSIPADKSPWGMLLKSELQQLSSQPDYYIHHEHLEDINEPAYFHDFMERATSHGLQYLTESDFGSTLPNQLPPDVLATLLKVAPDVIRQEQFLDFLCNRTFRQTLLVRSSCKVDRMISPERLRGCWLSSSLKSRSRNPDLDREVEEEFFFPSSGQDSAGNSLKTARVPTRRALWRLSEAWPASVDFDGLIDHALKGVTGPDPRAWQHVAGDLLQGFAAGLIGVGSSPSPACAHPGPRPVAYALARFQAAAQKGWVTNMRHQKIRIDPGLAEFLRLLDGTRDEARLQADMLRWLESRQAPGQKTPQADKGRVRLMVSESLAQLTRASLISG